MKTLLTEKFSDLKKQPVSYEREGPFIDEHLFDEELGGLFGYKIHFSSPDELTGKYDTSSSHRLYNKSISNEPGPGLRLFGNIIHPENRKVVYPALLAYARNKDHSNCFSFLQYINPKGKDQFEWFFSTSQYIKRFDKFVTIDIPLSSMGATMAKALELIAKTHYLYSNHRKLALLTKREKEILGLIALGLGNRELADKLFISRRTVEQHRKNIRKKLEVGSMAELYRYAWCCDQCRSP